MCGAKVRLTTIHPSRPWSSDRRGNQFAARHELVEKLAQILGVSVHDADKEIEVLPPPGDDFFYFYVVVLDLHRLDNFGNGFHSD